jgi:predicted DCC family thiol-disulfide oxidoreductase YuxK
MRSLWKTLRLGWLVVAWIRQSIYDQMRQLRHTDSKAALTPDSPSKP